MALLRPGPTTIGSAARFQKILVIVDGNASPRNAIEWSLRLGDATKTRVYVLGIQETAGPTRRQHVVAGRPEKYRAGLDNAVKAAVRQFESLGYKAEPVHHIDAPGDAIVWAADALSTDLVVTTAAFGNRAVGQGLDFSKHHVECALLFVRTRPRERPILVADDGSGASSGALAVANDLATRWSVDLVTWKSGGADLLVARHIAAAAAGADAGLIIVGTHARGALARFAFGSVSDRVAHASKTNVLVAPPTAGAS